MRWYSLPDAARKLGYLQRTLLQEIRLGRVHARLAGDRWWVSQAELQRHGVRVPTARDRASTRDPKRAA